MFVYNPSNSYHYIFWLFAGAVSGQGPPDGLQVSREAASHGWASLALLEQDPDIAVMRAGIDVSFAKF